MEKRDDKYSCRRESKTWYTWIAADFPPAPQYNALHKKSNKVILSPHATRLILPRNRLCDSVPLLFLYSLSAGRQTIVKICTGTANIPAFICSWRRRVQKARRKSYCSSKKTKFAEYRNNYSICENKFHFSLAQDSLLTQGIHWRSNCRKKWNLRLIVSKTNTL